jgi:hypothetical protein
MALPPSAATITVGQTLKLLDGSFRIFAEGVGEDRYTLWLGSGISLGRVDGLKQVVPRVIEFLRRQIAVGDPACRFKRALEEALALAQLSDDEKGRIDLTRSFEEWPDGLRIGNNFKLASSQSATYLALRPSPID